MTTILLIRHGESEANKQQIFAGHIDPALTEQGKLQAKITAQFILQKYRVDAVYASDLQRAYDTGAALGLPMTADKRLREIRAGQWEGKTFDQLNALYAESFGLWKTQIGKSACPGGESVEQLAQRIMGVLTEIARDNDGKTVAVAIHATPIRAVQCLIQTGSLEQMHNIPWVSNASVTEVAYDNGSWKIVAASQDSHLAELCTVLPANV